MSLLPSGKGIGIQGRYYNVQKLAEPVVTRIDHQIDLVWSKDTPDPLTNTDTFVVRWDGQVMARSTEVYIFTTVSDGGIRLWVNDRLLIDHWKDHTKTQDEGKIDLTAGQSYSIRIEYYKKPHSEGVKLLWSSPSLRREVVPQNQLMPARDTGK